MGEVAAPQMVVGIGEILWDVLPSGRHLGGAPANFARQAHALGAEGVIVSAVGDDPPGREILVALGRHGLSREYVSVVSGAATGKVAAVLDAQGIPTFTIQENAAWDVLPGSPALTALADRAEAVCFGTLAQRSALSRETIRGFLDATGPECLRTCDLNLRPGFFNPEIIRESLSRSRVLKLNEEELRALAGMLDLSGREGEILVRLREEFDLDVIALTRGSRGSRLLGRNSDSRHPGFRVEVADTVGAGDAFAAVLVLGLLANESLDAINDRANLVSASVCRRRGAWPEVPAGRGDENG
ncbi:MAG: carbohydrate kinase [Candidatus Aminicenantes bacterium]|nr:carbohydrate kinase [Candidatus Aminicenantes bacterium]